jgi:hypothetical protein
MGLIILMIIFVGLAAIIVWIADWTSGGRRYTALAILNHRFASGAAAAVIFWCAFSEAQERL